MNSKNLRNLISHGVYMYLTKQTVRKYSLISTLFALSTLIILPVFNAQAQPNELRVQQVVDFWTKERRVTALARDFVIDERGLGYLRKSNGQLNPYGHDTPATMAYGDIIPLAKSGGNGGKDTTPPDIFLLTPMEGEIVSVENHTFTAAVIDDLSGIKSVEFVITDPSGNSQSVAPVFMGKSTWQYVHPGLSDGNWSWYVNATDGAPKGGNNATSAITNFTVDLSGGVSPYIVSNDQWNNGGLVQTAAGRLYFQMPSSQDRAQPWLGYFCSGTVVTDNASGRSVILTASHCIYDDDNKAFARNVVFIPDQSATTGQGSDSDCTNDPFGCWVPAYGVVDDRWATDIFPNNKAWDYGYYVVSDSGAHQGTTVSSDALDEVAGSIPMNFLLPYSDDGDPSASSVDFTYALGYSFKDDPNFMYCAEDMTTEGSVNWWLSSCALTGGSSGGPWIQAMDTALGSGDIVSVISWSYSGMPGVAGPKLNESSAECLYNEARAIDFSAVQGGDGDAGVIVDYCP